MRNFLAGTLISQAFFEAFELWEKRLPKSSSVHHYSSEITAASQLFTFGIVPTVVQSHQARSILPRQACLEKAEQTLKLLTILGNKGVRAPLYADINTFIADTKKATWADKLPALAALTPTLSILLAWGIPLVVSNTTDLSREKIEESNYYNAFSSVAIAGACAAHFIFARRNSLCLTRQKKVFDIMERAQNLVLSSGIDNPASRLAMLLKDRRPDLDNVNHELESLRGNLEVELQTAINDIKDRGAEIIEDFEGIQTKLSQFQAGKSSSVSTEQKPLILNEIRQDIEQLEILNKVTLKTKEEKLQRFKTVSQALQKKIQLYINGIQEAEGKDALQDNWENYSLDMNNALRKRAFNRLFFSRLNAAISTCSELTTLEDIPIQHLCGILSSGLISSDSLLLNDSITREIRSIQAVDYDDDDSDEPLLTSKY